MTVPLLASPVATKADKAAKSKAAKIARLSEAAFAAIWIDSDYEDVDIEFYVRNALRGGVSPDARNEYGDTLLIQAIENDRPQIVRILLRAGANVNLRSNDVIEGDTPLIHAIRNSELGVSKPNAIIKMLLQRGANLNQRNQNEDTPLTLAASLGHSASVALLLQYQADFRLRNAFGLTPLAAATGDVHSLGVQMSEYEEVHALNEKINQGRANVRKLLLRAGAKE